LLGNQFEVSNYVFKVFVQRRDFFLDVFPKLPCGLEFKLNIVQMHIDSNKGIIMLLFAGLKAICTKDDIFVILPLTSLLLADVENFLGAGASAAWGILNVILFALEFH
jgi:hypothetical protein